MWGGGGAGGGRGVRQEEMSTIYLTGIHEDKNKTL